jgi:HEAT repeat protein
MRSLAARLITAGLSLNFLAAAQSEAILPTKVRISRIREMAKSDSAVIPTLAQYLSDPNRNIRIEAVKAIVKIGQESSLTPLVKATRDSDPEVQIRATDGLVNYYLPGYIAKGGLTGSLTKGVRRAKGFFSSRNDQVVPPDVQIRDDVAQALAEQVSSAGDPDVKANAALAAGILRARLAVPALVGSLHAKDSQVIFESLVALQKIKDPAGGLGATSAAHDLDERVQITALETIGMLRSLSSAPDVRSVLSGARNTKIRRAALEALAMLGIPGDRTTFLQYSLDRDPELRASALEGLGRIREPEDYPLLEQAYNEKDADWRVHMAAAFALVNQGKVDSSDFSPLPYLIENLDNRSRASVGSAYLAELARKEDVRKAMLPLISHATKDQKLAVCSVLGESQSEDVIPVLNSLAKDIDPDVAIAASKAIRTAQSRKPS